MSPPSGVSFASRYGPWGLLLGASDGVGEALARGLAARGLHLVLVARRAAPLEALAASLGREYGVSARPLPCDLGRPQAATEIAAACADLEVGTLIYCAGADPEILPLRERRLADLRALVERNCQTPLALCHHFLPPMADRGRGAVVLLSSGAGLQGIANLGAYAASKAFDLVLAETLWAEFAPQGVDVLAAVLGTTDTPAYRRTLARQGLAPEQVPGLMPADEAAEEILAHLGDGPVFYVGEAHRRLQEELRGLSRNERVRLVNRRPPPPTRQPEGQPT